MSCEEKPGDLRASQLSPISSKNAPHTRDGPGGMQIGLVAKPVSDAENKSLWVVPMNGNIGVIKIRDGRLIAVTLRLEDQTSLPFASGTKETTPDVNT